MKINELFARTRDSLTARVVYAEPYEKDGLTVIAAATVFGGGGGGFGHDKTGQEGEGGGFGLAAKPTGAFIIKDGDVWWQPAVDVNRMIGTIGAVVAAGLLAAARISKARAAAKQ